MTVVRRNFTLQLRVFVVSLSCATHISLLITISVVVVVDVDERVF